MIWQMAYTHKLPKLCSATLNGIFKARKQLKKYSVCLLRVLRIACHLPGTWTFLVKHDPVNYFVAKHVTDSLTPWKFHNFTQSNDAHVFTRIKEKSVMQISWFLDLYWRWNEDMLLEKWCISLPFHSVTLAITADHEAEEHFVCHWEPSAKDSKKWLSFYADWLRSIFYCYLLTFGDLSMLIGSEVYSIVIYLLSET